ncbi:MAG: amidohydrolase family protein [Desulfobacteraceae bacterium]|nr:amidohydrolase family protein [Desulfobacteraceae bacterium]
MEPWIVTSGHLGTHGREKHHFGGSVRKGEYIVDSIIAFNDVRIIDGTGAEPISGGAVVVEGNRIRDVLSHRATSLPPGARTIECKGRTLLPGLIDAHVHIICVEEDFGDALRKESPSLLTIRALSGLRQALDQGFTSLRDCGGLDAGFRTAIERGYAVGPRLKVSGRHLSMTGGHGDGRWPAEFHEPAATPWSFKGIVADGIEECRKAAREQLRQGVDFIKIMAGGGCLSPTDHPGASQYSHEEIGTVVSEASAVGTYVSAHCYSNQSISNCLEAGVKSIEHGNFINKETAESLVRHGAFLVPTLSAYEISPDHGDKPGFPVEYRRKIEYVRERSKDALKTAVDAGCIIGSGSDLFGAAQKRRAAELELKAEVMGALEAIRSATSVNARILGDSEELGSIEPGKLADMILVDGDPLENIGILKDYHEKIPVVMIDGKFHRNELI